MNQIASRAEAVEICESYNWIYQSEESGYVWDLEIEEDA